MRVQYCVRIQFHKESRDEARVPPALPPGDTDDAHLAATPVGLVLKGSGLSMRPLFHRRAPRHRTPLLWAAGLAAMALALVWTAPR